MSNKFKDNEYLELVIRIFVGFIFIYAAIDKIIYPAQFARIVYNYQLLPGGLVNLMAIILPWIEVICGLVLILGVYKRGSVYVINLMMIMFIVAIGINYFRGINLECGCFTVSTRVKGETLDLLIRDIGLLILTLYLFFNKATRFDLLKTKV